MALPTTYTAEEFAAYIKRDVLQYVADAMDWGVASLAPILPSKTALLYADVPLNQSYFDLTTVPTDITVGTEITFSGDTQVYRVADFGYADVLETRGRVKVFPYNKVAKTAGATATYTVGTTVKVTNPVYNYILDETLISLGYTDVSSINASNVHRFRLRGRVEAWRAVLSNTVGMVASESQEGGTYNRAQVYGAAFQQLAEAENEYNNLFSGQVSTGNFSASSTFTTVKGAW